MRTSSVAAHVRNGAIVSGDWWQILHAEGTHP